MPVEPPGTACRAAPGRPDPRLRDHVVGYAGFASGSGAPLAHRLLPFNLTALVISFDEPFGLVTGPRARATVDGPTTWGRGVTVGLTPAGVAELCGLPMSELSGLSVDWRDVLGPRIGPLADRLAAEPSWPARFALLDAALLGRLGPGTRGGVVGAAWQRLQGSRIPVGALADHLGVGRRTLEAGFRREIGLSPATVGRVSRLQRALGLLGQGAALARTAAGAGYADQSHFNRETRAMVGLTPAELCAFVQYRPLTTA